MRVGLSPSWVGPYLFSTVLLQAVEEMTGIGEPKGQHFEVFQMFLKTQERAKASDHWCKERRSSAVLCVGGAQLQVISPSPTEASVLCGVTGCCRVLRSMGLLHGLLAAEEGGRPDWRTWGTVAVGPVT